MKPKLDDRAFRARLLAAAAGALEKASVSMVGYVKRKLNVSARTENKAARDTRVRNAKARGRAFAKNRFTASAPGEAPRKRTGWLQRFTAHEVSVDGAKVLSRVGNGLKYAPHLELGTKTMAARPFLRPALAEYLPTFQRIASIELRRRLKG